MRTLLNAMIDISDIAGIIAIISGVLIGAFHLIIAGATLITIAKFAYNESKSNNSL